MKYLWLVLVIANICCIVVNVIDSRWDILWMNIIACALCLAEFVKKD